MSNDLYMTSVVFLDLAVIVILIVLAYLSKRLGEALKTPPFYKLFYVGVVLIVAGALVTLFFAQNANMSISKLINTIVMAIRFICSIVAVITCMQYWKWLFSEFFKG